MGGLNNTWLAQLAPAHAPPPPGWWLPAPGWWFLAVFSLAVAVMWVAWLRHPRSRQRRNAQCELRHLEASGVDDAALARGLEHLLRRYAVARYGREPVANLSGENWIAFVVAHGGSALAGEPGRDLLRAAYGGKGSAHRTEWLGGAKGFLRRRR